MNENKIPVIAVIGGGPAGLMAAGIAGELRARVILFETNPKCGRKLLLTGAGKCNITNSAPLNEFLEHYPENNKFLYPSFKIFFTEELEQFFNRYNLFFRYDENGKIFPKDNKSESVLDVLLTHCRENAVEFHQSETVKHIIPVNALVEDMDCSTSTDFNKPLSSYRWKVVTNLGVYSVDSVIIATGGLSYPGTSSNGSGYQMAKELSLCIIPTRPALVPIIIAEQWCAELTGISLQKIKLTLWESGNDETFNKITSLTEDILFTHFGVSGPAALFISRWIKALPNSYRLTIDLCSTHSFNDVENLLLKAFLQSPNKLLKTVVSNIFSIPQAVCSVLVRLCTTSEYIYCRDTTKKIRKKLVSLIKSLSLTVVETKGYSEAMVTAGGVYTREINPKTMESKLYPGLYFAGEVIDIDGFTGGFNLQAAFSTGYLAGRSASKIK